MMPFKFRCKTERIGDSRKKMGFKMIITVTVDTNETLLLEFQAAADQLSVMYYLAAENYLEFNCTMKDDPTTWTGLMLENKSLLKDFGMLSMSYYRMEASVMQPIQ